MSMSKVDNSEDADDKRGDWSKRLRPRKRDVAIDPVPGRDALEIFSPEVWTLIFQQNHLPWSSSSQKETAKNRLVCKTWRDVIDEQLKFRITLDDRKMDFSTLGHLIVKRCVITHLLTKTFPEMPIFRDASKLQELFVWGPITPRNFQALMQQFSQITTLFLTDVPFQNKDMLMVLSNPETLNNFWTQLTNLTVSWNSLEEPSPAIFYLPVSHLESFTFSWHMLSSQYWVDTVSVPMFNLISRMVNLKKMNLQYYKYADSGDAPEAPPIQFPTANLHNVQKLETVRLTTSPFVLASWIPLLKQQTRLSDFRIIDRELVRDKHTHFTLSQDLLDELQSILIRNQNTLTSVEITNYVSKALNCAVFQNMNLLKRLVLKRRFSPYASTLTPLPLHLTNLSLLPTTLETLSLSFLCCNSADLNLMTDRLDNIQSAKFEGIGHVVYRKEIPAYVEMENTGVTQQALENLAGKENMKDVFISFLFQDKFNVVLRKEKKYVKVGRLFMELLGNGDRPWPYINFDFEKARKGKQEILRSK